MYITYIYICVSLYLYQMYHIVFIYNIYCFVQLVAGQLCLLPACGLWVGGPKVQVASYHTLLHFAESHASV